MENKNLEKLIKLQQAKGKDMIKKLNYKICKGEKLEVKYIS